MKLQSPKIWVDLDNTLIATWQPLITDPLLAAITRLPIDLKPPSGRGRRRLRRIGIGERACVYSCARRIAPAFLAALRHLAPVMLLTSATREYAQAISDAFGLGFEAGEIAARGELGIDIDPHGVLVENCREYSGDFRHFERQARKLRHLGRYAGLVEVPFSDGSSVDPFDRRWRGSVAKVDRLLRRKRRVLNPVERRRRKAQARMRRKLLP